MSLSKGRDLLLASVAIAAMVCAISAPAQVLARPGWAGSGVTVEPWWYRAVFYRLDIARFQATGDSARGDLAGVTQRLGYLQSLGVDAVILNPSGAAQPRSAAGAAEASAFEDLTRAAANDHLRVIVDLGAPTSSRSGGSVRSDATAQYLARARAWLNQGAAGLYVPTRQLAALGNPGLAAYLVGQLRALTNGFPGARILLDEATPDAPAALIAAVGHDAQLTLAPPIALTTPDAASLRRQMLAELPSANAATAIGAANLLWARRRLPPNLTPAQRDGLERALAAVLLASRTAVLIDYGQELGEEEAGPQRPAAAGTAPLMQWNPTNLTRHPRPARAAGSASSGPVYGVFHPYVKPLPRDLFTPPDLPDVELSDTRPTVDPASLPGFTAGELAPALAAFTAPNAATANVAVEDGNPNSLLNLYRRLIQLHNENATLRGGAQDILDFDADDALLWLRRPPAGAHTSTTVLVACNLSARPFALSPDAIGRLHLRRVPLRNLLSLRPPQAAREPRARETTDNLDLPAYSIFLGDLHP